MKICQVTGEYIQLNQLLKRENLAGSGGQAKEMIERGLVKVNGTTATEIRKKLRSGDIVEFEGEKLQIQTEN